MSEIVRSTGYTYEDYLGFPDDGNRYQIIWGEKLVTPSPVPRHQIAVGNLFEMLSPYVRERNLGRVLVSPIAVRLAVDCVVEPDVIFISSERLSIIGEKAILAAPDLAVEVLSDSTRRIDFNLKRKLFAAFGVREYWIVDPKERRVEIYVLKESRLEKATEHASGEFWSAAVLPGFRADVEEIFA